MDQESLLLEALQPPISRGIWDNVIKCSEIQLLLSTLSERIESRKLGKDWIPHPAEIGGPIKTVTDFFSLFFTSKIVYCCLNQLLRRLGSEGLSPSIEEQLLRMKEVVVKLQRQRLAMEQQKQVWNEQGVIHLTSVKSRSVDLHSTEMLMKAMVYYAQLQSQQTPFASDHRPGEQSPVTFTQMNPVI